MTLSNSCRGMALQIVQRNKAPDEAWRNLKSYCRAKGTRKIRRLSHKVNGKTMEPGGDPFKFIREIDKLAADLPQMGDTFVTDLKNA